MHNAKKLKMIWSNYGIAMYCPQCKSSHNKKNGFRNGKQSYKCKNCGDRYVENPVSRRYSVEIKQLCLNSVVGDAELNSVSPTLEMYLNGMGFRAIAPYYRNRPRDNY